MLTNVDKSWMKITCECKQMLLTILFRNINKDLTNVNKC